MINPQVDEQSMMTYLSQYPNARLQPGAPVKPNTHAHQVRCYGTGWTRLIDADFDCRRIQF